VTEQRGLSGGEKGSQSAKTLFINKQGRGKPGEGSSLGKKGEVGVKTSILEGGVGGLQAGHPYDMREIIYWDGGAGNGRDKSVKSSRAQELRKAKS